MNDLVYEIWDKRTSINGVLAETILNNNPKLNNIEIIIFKDKNNIVKFFEKTQQLKSLLDLDPSTTTDDVAKAYIKYLNNQQNASHYSSVNTEEEIKKIKTQNEILFRNSVNEKLERAKLEKQIELLNSKINEINGGK